MPRTSNYESKERQAQSRMLQILFSRDFEKEKAKSKVRHFRTNTFLKNVLFQFEVPVFIFGRLLKMVASGCLTRQIFFAPRTAERLTLKLMSMNLGFEVRLGWIRRMMKGHYLNRYFSRQIYNQYFIINTISYRIGVAIYFHDQDFLMYIIYFSITRANKNYRLDCLRMLEQHEFRP